MNKFFIQALSALAFIASVVLLTMYSGTVDALAGNMSGMNLISYATYVLILVVAVVVMPIAVMPIIPVAASLLGPFATAVLSVVGWTVGGMLAFLVARYLGRPVIERFVSLQKVDEVAARIPKDTRFLVIVLMRLTLPVDIISYALGLSRTIGFVEYSLATFVGVIWFSFAFAYLGDALIEKDALILLELGAASTAVFGLGWYFLRVMYRKEEKERE